MRDPMEPSCRDRGGLIPLSHRYKYGPVNHSMRQARSVEDAALDYNPVTGRFEVVRSVREEMRVEL